MDDVWEFLNSQPGVGVAVLDVNGVLQEVNPQMRWLFGWTGGSLVGTSIGELEGPEFAAERLSVFRQVIASQTPAVIRHLRQGCQTETTLWPLDAPDAVCPRVLKISRHGGPSPVPSSWLVVESRLAHLGPLDRLTPRELEVMIRLGRGSPLKTIASELRLSLRTVERNRTAISGKLNVTSLAQIAGLVHRCGLKIEHAHLTRLGSQRFDTRRRRALGRLV